MATSKKSKKIMLSKKESYSINKANTLCTDSWESLLKGIEANEPLNKKIKNTFY